MILRNKLLLAQLPLALALVVVGLMSYRAVRQMGVESQSILKDNFRSVRDAQAMQVALAGLNSDAVSQALHGASRESAAVDADLSRFESNLADQEDNITEVGEAEATHALREAWDRYRAAFVDFRGTAEPTSSYVGRLEPLRAQVTRPLATVFALNMDAMARKNEEVRSQVDRYQVLLVFLVLSASAAGLVLSATLMGRILRRLGILRQAVKRVGAGDLEARIALRGSDELSAIAEDFNQMTGKLRAYRQSSLGDLFQAQEAAQATLDSFSDPVLVFDAKSALTTVNAAARAAFSFSDQDQDVAKLPPALREAVERARTHVLGGRGAYVPKGFEEALSARTSGGEAFFLVRATPVYAIEGGVVGAAVVLQDVTRLRLFDDLKNDLVATVAHEFRSPLTSLRMALHLTLEGVPGPLTEKQQDVLYAAREDCERLQGIVEDLLDVARIQSGRLELSRRAVRVSSLLERLATDFRREAEEKGLALRVEPAPEGLTLDVDPERLALVFSNLLNNALHFTPRGGQVEVRVRMADTPGRVRFEVADTGPGIAPEYQARVFEKFFQVPGAPRGSAGLGLYIAREIIRGHGGDLGVESALGKGSTFWFTLPAT